MKSKIGILGGVLLAASAMAQDAKPPALLAKGEDGTSTPLRVDDVDVEVNVIGNTAETVMTLRFRNDTDRILEGELVFPLGEGRTVSRYALEIEGKMREGVAVPKNRGRAVFESIVRRGIDPGLLEWTKGNNFRTRIYPIPANGTKSVRIGYEEELQDDGDSYRYQLPLAFAEKLDRFRLRVEAARPGEDGAGIQIEGLEAKTPNNQAWVIETEEKDYLANKPLTIRIPREKGESVSVEEREGELYFHVLDRPALPDAARARPKPQSVHLIWDASRSGSDRDTEKELEVLQQLLAWTGEATVTLSLLRNDLEAAGSFQVKGGKCAPLVEKLTGLAYDGGTQMGLVDLTSATADLVVLVSDGVSTLGKARLEGSARPVVVMHAAASAEHGLLRNLAQSSGGAYLNLTETKVADAVSALTEMPFSLVKITVDGDAEAVSEVYPRDPTPVVREIAAAGKLRDDKPVTLVLHYGWGQKADRQQRITIDPTKHRTKLGRVPRLWAQKKLATLELNAGKNRRAITNLGKDHSLVTRFTSLIVLDRIEDYVEFRIEPPEEDMRKEYERLLEDAPSPDEPNPQRMEDLLGGWKKLVRWRGKAFAGLDKSLFKQVEELRPGLKRLQKLQKEDKKAEGIETLVEDMTTLVKMADQLEGIAEDQRGDKWNQGLQDLSTRIHGLQAKSLELGLLDSVGGADPFGGEEQEEGLLRRAVGALGGAILGASVDAELAPAAEAPPAATVAPSDDYEPPELPNSTGSFGGGGDAGQAFPVTPATPTDFSAQTGSIVTGGLRSGDAAITRNSIDAILNNPDRTANEQVEVDAFAPADPFADADGLGAAAPVEAPPAPPARPEAEADPFADDPPAPVGPPAYLKALQSAKDKEELEKVFTEWNAKIEAKDTVAFLLDASDEFLAKEDRKMALRTLTTLAELAPEHVGLLRVLGHRLDQIGELSLAEKVFREVHSLRDEEPQSWRDLALVLEKRGQHQEALGLLWTAIMQEWDGRFGHVQLILLNELNALLTRHGDGLDLTGVDQRFLHNLDCDLRVVLSWDADATDVDLWVTGPAGERCFYEHNRTFSGGRLSEDLTNGYGPEEFLIRKALPGKYQVQAHFYGNNRQDLTGSTTLQAVLIRDWGRPTEKRRAVTLRLRSTGEVVAAGEIRFPEP